jgi:hypothetical protein
MDWICESPRHALDAREEEEEEEEESLELLRLRLSSRTWFDYVTPQACLFLSTLV